MLTAAGTSTGLFATRDMTISQLEYCAEDFATNASSASSTISHHTFTGRNDRNTQTTANGRQCGFTRIITQTWTAHAVKLSNNRLAFKIFQINSQFLLSSFANGITINVTLIREYFCHTDLQLGRWHGHSCFTHLLCIANAGQHICQRILHAHQILLLKLSRGLPAGFNQAGDITAHGCFTQFMTAQAELAIDTMRTTSYTTTTTLTTAARIAWHFLQLDLRFPNLRFSRRRTYNSCFQLSAFGCEFFYGFCALYFACNHRFFSHDVTLSL